MCRELPPGFYKKDRVSVCVWTCLTNRYTCSDMPLAPPKLVGFNHWDTEYFHKQQRQLRHNASVGAGPPSAVGGFPPFPVSFFNIQGLGRISSASVGGRCCCPAPSSIEAEASPQPPSLAPSPAHTQGLRAHFEGMCHQYHFPRLDLRPFHCRGPARSPLPPPGRRWPLWAGPCSPGVRSIPKDFPRPPLQIRRQGPTPPSPVS